MDICDNHFDLNRKHIKETRVYIVKAVKTKKLLP